jgi:hypothetical protein
MSRVASGAGQKELHLEPPAGLIRDVDRHFGKQPLAPYVISKRVRTLVDGLEVTPNDVA